MYLAITWGHVPSLASFDQGVRWALHRQLCWWTFHQSWCQQDEPSSALSSAKLQISSAFGQKTHGLQLLALSCDDQRRRSILRSFVQVSLRLHQALHDVQVTILSCVEPRMSWLQGLQYLMYLVVQRHFRCLMMFVDCIVNGCKVRSELKITTDVASHDKPRAVSCKHKMQHAPSVTYSSSDPKGTVTTMSNWTNWLHLIATKKIGWFPPIPHTGNRHDFPSQPLQISSKGVVPCFPDLSKSLEEAFSSACFKAIEDLQRCRNGLKKCLNASHIKCTKMYQGSTFASTRALTASCWPISTATFALWKVKTCGNIGSYMKLCQSFSKKNCNKHQKT